MSEEETAVEKPPTRRAMLVFKKSVSSDQINRIGQALQSAIENDAWPVLIGNVGPIEWYSLDAPPDNEHPVGKIRVYKDRNDEWRWRAWSHNNTDILADSGEGYINFDDAADMAERLFPGRPVDMRKYLYLEVNG
jgi:uncharacterized protein YegP (UPF0339 family)